MLSSLLKRVLVSFCLCLGYEQLVFADDIDSVAVVLIPKGTFYMGCEATLLFDCDHENPVHKVSLSNDIYMIIFQTL